MDLAIGESGIAAEKPITVGQLMKDAVARFPKHPALKHKEDGIWNTITYTGYYDHCIKAAKSFLKVRVEADSELYGWFFCKAKLHKFAFLTIENVANTDIHDVQ